MKRIVILGSGESGTGAAILAKNMALMYLYQIKEQYLKNTKRNCCSMLLLLKNYNTLKH